jgi:hypothetical protein
VRAAAAAAAAAAVATAPVEASTRWQPCPQGESLVAWVRANGGRFDDRLTITSDTPSGSRGVVATQPIGGADDADDARPPIQVPEDLYMTSAAATFILQQRIDEHAASIKAAEQRRPPATWLTAAAAALAAAAAGITGSGGESAPPPVSAVDPLSRLALLLAHERAKGAASFWAPYIANLSPAPPCAWQMHRDDLRAALESIAASRGAGGGPAAVAEWEAAVARAGDVARARAAALAAAYGPALGVDAAGAAWALAHVVSRAFGSGEDVALAPLVDSCNHRAGAGRPWAMAAGGGGDGGPGVSGGGRVLVCVSPERGGAPVALRPGEELCISYGSIERGGETGLSVFLNFGFCPAGLEM